MSIQIQFATPALVRSGETLYVNFADGAQLELTGATGIQDYVAANTPDAAAVRAMFVANRLAMDPLLDSLSSVWDGKKMTLDLEQALPANVVKVQ